MTPKSMLKSLSADENHRMSQPMRLVYGSTSPRGHGLVPLALFCPLDPRSAGWQRPAPRVGSQIRFRLQIKQVHELGSNLRTPRVRELDLTDEEAEKLGGRQVARRGRRPKRAS
jgi:hypothetical protein